MCATPSAFIEYERKARKSHTCGECRKPIRPGDSYEEVTGIWDGHPGRHRTCQRCKRVRELALKKYRSIDFQCGYEDNVPFVFGSLYAGLRYWLRERRSDREWKKQYWKAKGGGA
ncbi:MAG: hypothetical protein B7733_06260 [Myxococcales bacterium FL481]|nr:MAG: hypothetical protein B7733_06260 [Myxococcales bacterium FL481]